jgi:hypothetical protein
MSPLRPVVVEASRSGVLVWRNFRDAVAFQRRPVETLARRRRMDGRLFQLTSAVAGRMLVVGAPELAREVLYAPPGTFLTGAANRRILPVLPQNSVLTLDRGGAPATASRARAAVSRRRTQCHCTCDP